MMSLYLYPELVRPVTLFANISDDDFWIPHQTCAVVEPCLQILKVSAEKIADHCCERPTLQWSSIRLMILASPHSCHNSPQSTSNIFWSRNRLEIRTAKPAVSAFGTKGRESDTSGSYVPRPEAILGSEPGLWYDCQPLHRPGLQSRIYVDD